VLWDSRGFTWRPEWNVANVPVDHLQPKLGDIADFIYGSPSQSMWVIGVTGTNGKTSCTQWIGAALDRPGRRAAVLGTLGNGLVGHLVPSENTTADAASLHGMLAEFREAGATEVVMEVSSHGLDQGRVNGVKFDIALFTNLTPRSPRLPQHDGRLRAGQGASVRMAGTQDQRDQRRRFVWAEPDRRGEEARPARADLRSWQRRCPAPPALRWAAPASGCRSPRRGATARRRRRSSARSTWTTCSERSPCCWQPTCRWLTRSRRCRSSRRHRGGCSGWAGDGKPLVVVDYAHTPDALEKALTALRPSVGDGGELVCVFGAGGQRDPGKRPQMGRIAASLADRLVITSDNPRFESPSEIASAISRGVRETGNRRWGIELDRAKAIAGAIAEAKAADVVLLAGKGHEMYQETRRHAAALFGRRRSRARVVDMGRRMMDTATAARVVGGRVVGANVTFSRVTTDTRALARGDLFVALKGERFDGHDFVATALQRGAAAALVAADRAAALTGDLVAVPDTLAALGTLAAHWRARFSLPLAVVVGSNGKTNGQGNDRCDLSRACGRVRRAGDARQPEQRDRDAADAAWPRCVAPARRRRDRNEPSWRNP
jgi:UDP-N-acetylmuramyl tripeptide synthase